MEVEFPLRPEVWPKNRVVGRQVDLSAWTAYGSARQLKETSPRAGSLSSRRFRDGTQVRILLPDVQHLIGVQVNERLLATTRPGHDQLVQVRRLAQAKGQDGFGLA